MKKVEDSDAWQYTLNQIASVTSINCEDRRRNHSQKTQIQRELRVEDKSVIPSDGARIEIIECTSTFTIIVSCRDSIAGQYGNQLWKLAKARRKGACALTGVTIRRGDYIFRPFSRGYIPINVNWMVLASMVPGWVGFVHSVII